jgi:hypothetical protein
VTQLAVGALLLLLAPAAMALPVTTKGGRPVVWPGLPATPTWPGGPTLALDPVPLMAGPLLLLIGVLFLVAGVYALYRRPA